MSTNPEDAHQPSEEGNSNNLDNNKIVPDVNDGSEQKNQEMSAEEKTLANKAQEAENNIKEEVSTEETTNEVEDKVFENEIDFHKLSKEELVKVSQELTTVKDVVKAEQVVKEIREVIEDIRREESEIAKAKFLEEGGDEDGFEYRDKDIDAFFTNYKTVRSRKKQYFEDLQSARDNNLKAKKKVINEINEILDSSNQSGAMAKVKELQKKWKEIGAVPQADADDLYKTYHALLDRFYDNMSIEFELKELDRKKNLELKLALCERAESLLEEENINEAVTKLNLLHDEFKSIGPVPKEEQDAVWDRFKKASDVLYDKRRAHAEEFKKVLNENMQKKQDLCLQVEKVSDFDSDRIKEWNEKTKELLAIQEEWDKIGPLPREVAKDINKQFWGNFKSFFARKNKFFEKLEAFRAENLKKKEELVAKAEELKDSEDWNTTTNDLKRLQEDWKKIGPVPEKFRDSVYEKFKAACDVFFERKRSQRKEQDKEFLDNLKKKEEIILEINTLAKEDGDFNIDLLKEKVQAFMAIGFVPRRDKDAIMDKLLNACETYLDTSSLEGDEKETQKLKFKADIFKSVPGGGRFKNQESKVRNRITNLENDIALWQNNLAFFANSKTADKMREEYNEKISKAQAEIKVLKDQLRIIRSIEN
ncbi:DUF349 domain-containing protein [Sediminitomix flava]|uniref:Uncharacterized protein DUF349 n=1 Tax=Sediminitomix flava TaxID=379075 RepID=A0A315Z7U2_SEDFL|nr:DUF349 domain-containing protein [Sediminitomix flava]PWJ40224.1 uncharacterized protein DUF349 [Sediminitomix flava]